jgi:hypothetical protein
MEGTSPFIAAFTDGTSDTLLLAVGANDSTTCRLSNIHGGVTLTSEAFGLSGSTEDCVSSFFESAGSIDISGLIPPTPVQVICSYTISVTNLHYGHMTFNLARTAGGLILQYVYANISGNFSAPAPGILCPDITGSVSISSVTVETHVDISGGDNPQVTLGSTTATVDGLQVNVNGALGFIVEAIIGLMQGTFTNGLEDAIASAINNKVGGDLSFFINVKSSCAR